jgi:hypothetical protein
MNRGIPTEAGDIRVAARVDVASRLSVLVQRVDVGGRAISSCDGVDIHVALECRPARRGIIGAAPESIGIISSRTTVRWSAPAPLRCHVLPRGALTGAVAREVGGADRRARRPRCASARVAGTRRGRSRVRSVRVRGRAGATGLPSGLLAGRGDVVVVVVRGADPCLPRRGQVRQAVGRSVCRARNVREPGSGGDAARERGGSVRTRRPSALIAT